MSQIADSRAILRARTDVVRCAGNQAGLLRPTYDYGRDGPTSRTWGTLAMGRPR